ncbi:MAG: hypothetical protein ABIT37_07655 [Luteolibacter sp.]
MQLMPVIALLEHLGSSAFDDMLRLIGIAAIISVVFKGIRSFANKQSAAPAVTSPPTATVKPNVPEEISPEIIAIIAVAISCFTSQPHRIVSIKRQSTSWEKAGRQSVLSSHRIR